MMSVLNFAHASFYMLGAYFSYTILKLTGSFWLSLVIAPLSLFIIGALVERFLLRKVHIFGHVHELLLTFGLAYIISEMVKWIWGNYPLSVDVGGLLSGSMQIFGITYPVCPWLRCLCGFAYGIYSLQNPNRHHRESLGER